MWCVRARLLRCVCRSIRVVSVIARVVGWDTAIISQDAGLGGAGSLVIVCGHASRQNRVGGKCQGVAIIADSILRA